MTNAALEYLCTDVPLRGLLEHYGLNRRARDAWQDRVAGFAELPADRLSRMHGLLLAYGWLEARVAADCLEEPGLLRRAYRVTRDGLAALDQTASGVPSPPDGPLTAGLPWDDE